MHKIFEEEADWWDEISEEEQQQIKTGLDQLDRREYVAHEKVMKGFDKWR